MAATALDCELCPCLRPPEDPRPGASPCQPAWVPLLPAPQHLSPFLGKWSCDVQDQVLLGDECECGVSFTGPRLSALSDPGRVARGRCLCGHWGGTRSTGASGSLELQRLLFPSSSPCPEERGCCRGLAGPPTDLDTQDWPACFSCPPGHPPLGQHCLQGTAIGERCSTCYPSALPTGTSCGPLPSPRAEPRAPGPFLLPSLGFHAGRSHSRGHCSGRGLAPLAFLTSISVPWVPLGPLSLAAHRASSQPVSHSSAGPVRLGSSA